MLYTYTTCECYTHTLNLNVIYTHTALECYTNTKLECHIYGWKEAVSHRHIQINFEVIANHFGKVIRQIFLALRITFGCL